MCGSRKIIPYSGIFIPGSLSSSQFADGVPECQIWALRLDFARV